jgi:putative lipoprotein (rSAM/lipoprotein system)
MKRVITYYQKIKSAWLRFFLSAMGLSAVCFIFEACYGTPTNLTQPNLHKINISGKLIDQETHSGIKDIRLLLSSASDMQDVFTDENGRFSTEMNLLDYEEIQLSIDDADGEENKLYLSKDSMITFDVEKNRNDKMFIEFQLYEYK